jgi:hypothetical protein
MYEMILARGWPQEKVVVGLLTNPENGSGWLPWEVLGAVVPVLCGRHPRFGGVMGWEYFNSLPGGREKPWEWARWMTVLLRGERTVWDALMAGKEISYVKEGDKGQEQKKIVSGPTEGVGKEAQEGDEGEGPVPEPFQYYSDGSDGEQ